LLFGDPMLSKQEGKKTIMITQWRLFKA